MSGFPMDNPIIRWVEYRLPVFSLLQHEIIDYPTPRNLNYWWNYGSIAGICLVIQMVTGIVLAMHYTPQADLAFDSVEHIMRNVNYGWLMRYIHSNGGSMFFLVVFIHLFRGLYYGSYKAPREILWWLGVVLLLLMMANAFTGYVLPWGQMSFWAAKVITSMFTAVPFVGDLIVSWLWGSFTVDNPTLVRFYSFHYLIPFIIAGVVVVHLWALHTHGSNNPLGIDAKGPQDKIPFTPYYTIKDLFGFAIFFIFFAFFVFYAPNYLAHPDQYIPANPLVTPPHIVPEWYFLPFYAILRAIPHKLGGVVAMFGSTLILFVVPWLDTSRVRSARFRPLFRFFFWVFVADTFILGWVGANTPDATVFGGLLSFLLIGRLATAWYFLHFLLILPLVGLIEKPKPLPQSISAAVLEGAGGAPAPASAQEKA